MPAPYRPRHRRSSTPYGPVGASYALSLTLAVALLLAAAFVVGGLLAHPFS
jgi:hypothetical protein